MLPGQLHVQWWVLWTNNRGLCRVGAESARKGICMLREGGRALGGVEEEGLKDPTFCRFTGWFWMACGTCCWVVEVVVVIVLTALCRLWFV